MTHRDLLRFVSVLTSRTAPLAARADELITAAETADGLRRPAEERDAVHVGGFLGAQLAQLARSAFVSGMDLGLATGACVAVAGCLIALIVLPSKAPDEPDEPDAD